MKKTFALISISLLLLFHLSGCGGGGATITPQQGATNQPTQNTQNNQHTIVGTVINKPSHSWKWLNPAPHGNHIYDIEIVGDNTVFIVGTNGLIMKSDDYGGAWESQYSGSTKNLNDIQCLNDNLCYAGGESGYLIRTIDGGANWEQLSSGSQNAIAAIECFKELHTCYAVSYYDDIAKTLDDGKTWTEVPLSVSGDSFYDIECSSDASKCIIPRSFDRLLILTNDQESQSSDWEDITNISCPESLDRCYGIDKWSEGFFNTSSDQGQTWTTTNTGAVEIGRQINCVDNSTCFIVGDAGLIQKTTDSGTTWATLTSGTTTMLTAVACMTGGLTCFAGGNNGVLLKTTDGGASWSPAFSTISDKTFTAMSCSSDTNCFIVGDAGIILKTTDGGASWQFLASGTTQYLKDISCSPSGDTCYVVGREDTVLKTMDSGSTWTPVDIGIADDYELNSIDCPTETTCYIGSDAIVDVLKTTDGGATWAQLPAGDYFSQHYAAECLTENSCYMVGHAGSIIKTTNGGASWSQQYTDPWATLISVHCPVDETVCYASGMYGMLSKTTDSGATWTTLTTPVYVDNQGAFYAPYISEVHCSSGAETCYIAAYQSMSYIEHAGGFIYKTSDGGTTWSSSVALPGLINSIVCPVDDNTCYAVGEMGTIMKYTAN